MSRPTVYDAAHSGWRR